MDLEEATTTGGGKGALPVPQNEGTDTCFSIMHKILQLLLFLLLLPRSSPSKLH